MTVGRDMNSCTAQLQYVILGTIPHRPALKNKRLVIVDTPGFDDTYKDDVEILRRISGWMASS